MRTAQRRRFSGLSGVLLLTALAVPLLPGPSAAADGPCASPTMVGTVGPDKLVGTDGADVIDGLAGKDVITGLGGDDVLCGGEGADLLEGGDGDDALHGQTDGLEIIDPRASDYFGDTLAGGPGDDLLDPGADERKVGSADVLSFRGSTAGVVVDLTAGTATGEGSDRVVGAVLRVRGTDHDDVLLGSEAGDELFGHLGSDYLDGRGGHDDLWSDDYVSQFFQEVAETTPHVLIGGPGNDFLEGSDGDDDLRGGHGGDIIDGERGTDLVDGGPSRDFVRDVVTAADGHVVSGGPGRDDLEIYFVGRDSTLLREAVVRVDLAAGTARARAESELVSQDVPGFEDLTVTSGRRWHVLGTDGPNTVFAGGGVYGRAGVPVVVRALGGRDYLEGSRRHDVLDGGDGQDMVYRSSGDDRHIDIEKVRG